MPKISQDRIQQRLVDRDLRHSKTVEQLVEVPTVLSPSLLQQRQFRVVVCAVFKVFAQDKFQPRRLRFLALQTRRFNGFFRTFPRFQKSAQSRREFECEGARALELIHAEFSSSDWALWGAG